MALQEQAMEAVYEDIDEIKRDVKAVLRNLNEMSGGKKALLWLFSIAGAVVGIIATLGSVLAFKD
jgi:hypothetical protein